MSDKRTQPLIAGDQVSTTTR